MVAVGVTLPLAFRDPCLPETGLWHSAMRTSGNVLDLCGASRHPMSEQDCQGLFPYCTKIPSVGQYLSRSLVHIFCRQTVPFLNGVAIAS